MTTDSIPSAPTRFRGWHVAAFGLALVGVYLLLNATRLPFSVVTLREHAGGHTILNLLPYYDAATAYEHLASYSLLISASMLAAAVLWAMIAASRVAHRTSWRSCHVGAQRGRHSASPVEAAARSEVELGLGW